MWRDLDTMRLTDGKWQFNSYEMSKNEHDFVNSIKTRNILSVPDRYIKELQYGHNNGLGKVAITSKSSKKKDMGCRALANVLHRIASDSGWIEGLPSRIYIQANGFSFLTRGLLTLWYLSLPARRQTIMQHYTWHPVSKYVGEGASDYEKRAIQIISQSLTSYRRVEPKSLCLPDVRSKPDGLFLHPAGGELVIVEAKMNVPDFSDGIAQLVQYYAQALSQASYRNLQLSSYLITSGTEQTEGYRFWLDLARSPKKLSMVVNN
ncbi:MAG TPA: hypothetical protein VFA07_11305 [Chthonomonadaceae bacterium]|nr:hypothetical protein [Chthonomonadaceae bacterium]